MPRILPTFAAFVVIGVCIALNTMRYPIVWEMVGPNAQISKAESPSPPAEIAPPTKPAPSAMAAEPPPASPLASVANNLLPPPITAEKPVIESSVIDKAVPIALPKDQMATDVKPLPDKNATPPAESLIEPSRPLVRVTADPFPAGATINRGDEAVRLPPVESQIVDHYTTQYPPAGVPIYPSTGK